MSPSDPAFLTITISRNQSSYFDAIPKCIDCHRPGNAVKVDLTAVFDPEIGLINRKNSWPRSSRPILVVPGDPDASALMLKIEETELPHSVEGDPMPWKIARLTSGELQTLHDWIESGAENDATYRVSVRKIFGDGISLGSRGGKCTYCHGAGNETGLDLSNPFDPVIGARSVPAVRGGIRIVPGNAEASVLYQRVDPDLIPADLEPLMPRQADRITPEEATLIRTWILQGALNN